MIPTLEKGPLGWRFRYSWTEPDVINNLMVQRDRVSAVFDPEKEGAQDQALRDLKKEMRRKHGLHV